MAIITIHHCADHDGQCSAAIVKEKYPECELIPMDYGMSFPWGRIATNDTVFMVDFALEPIERMIHLDKKCKLIWIDHHISSIDDAKAASFDPEGLRVNGKSACELTWEYLNPGVTIPHGIHLLGRYDVWDHSNPDALAFHYGLTSYDTDPANVELWQKVFTDESFVAEVVKEGTIISRYVEKTDAEYLAGYAFDATLAGFRCLALNRARSGSLAFAGKWDPEKYDVMLMFAHNGTDVNVSVYTDKPNVDMSKLAKRYGGGGHASASGFSLANVPLMIKDLKKV